MDNQQIEVTIKMSPMYLSSSDRNGMFNRNAGNISLSKEDSCKIEEVFWTKDHGIYDICIALDNTTFTFCELNPRLSSDNLSFRINDPIFLKKLQSIFAYTYSRLPGEKCDAETISFTVTKEYHSVYKKNYLVFRKNRISTHEETPEIRTIRSLLLSSSSAYNTVLVKKDEPSWIVKEWFDYGEIEKHAAKEWSVYCWYGFNRNDKDDNTLYMYIGIAGSRDGSKGTIGQRIKSEYKKNDWPGKDGNLIEVEIERFRYSQIYDNAGVQGDMILHAIETQEITLMSSLLYCYNAQPQFTPNYGRNQILSVCGTIKCSNNTTRDFSDIVLINSQTAWNFVEER